MHDVAPVELEELLAICLSRAAHAQQPFLKYGVTVKVATLSNGRFQEFFANDSLRRIGSVVYNTRLRRIAYLLPGDSLVGRVKPEVTSRWFSPDPLAEKYMSISPYVFAADNPIRYMDTDGREIVDPKGRAAYIQNKDGSYAFTKYATQDIKTFVTELSKNDAGMATLTGLVKTATKVGIEITTDRGEEGSAEAEGQTIATNAFGVEETMKDPNTGEEVYKKAQITIYGGTHADEVQSGKGAYAKSSLGKFINGIGTHEGRHVLNNLQAAKKAQEASKAAGASGEDAKAARKAAIEVVPNAEEKRANESYPAN